MDCRRSQRYRVQEVFSGHEIGQQGVGYWHLSGAGAAVEKGQHDKMPRLDDAGEGQAGEDCVVGELQREDVAKEPPTLKLVGEEPRDRRHQKQRDHRREGRHPDPRRRAGEIVNKPAPGHDERPCRGARRQGAHPQIPVIPEPQRGQEPFHEALRAGLLHFRRTLTRRTPKRQRSRG